jgi:hypothetical protein
MKFRVPYKAGNFTTRGYYQLLKEVSVPCSYTDAAVGTVLLNKQSIRQEFELDMSERGSGALPPVGRRIGLRL